jgi:hypothetical protein
MDVAGKETIVTVIEHDGAKWQINEPVPGDPGATKVVRMFLLDGVVEIFALPTPGTELDTMKQGLHFTLMPLSIKVVCAVARFDEWQKIVAETEKALTEPAPADDDDDDEMDDDDLEEATQYAAPPGYLPPGAPQAYAQPAPAPFVPPQQVAQPVAVQEVPPPPAPAAPAPSYVPSIASIPGDTTG